jgi:AmmeMemoRadiSam system protein B
MGKILLPEKKIRSPVVGGLFYPENKKEAVRHILSFGLERGKGGCAQAIIAPHGAWAISGKTAAEAFSAAAGRLKNADGTKGISTVVLLGIIHKHCEEGLYLSDSFQFKTPLGNLPVDQELSEELCSCSTLFQVNDIPHLEEHSVEVLLPFVKYCFPEADIVPVLMRGSRPSLVSGLARSLRIVFDSLKEETLFVLSMNLSSDKSENEAVSRAEKCASLIRKNDFQGFEDALEKTGISPSGGQLAASFMESGLAADKTVRLLSDHWTTAKDEDSSFICYGALSFE